MPTCFFTTVSENATLNLVAPFPAVEERDPMKPHTVKLLIFSALAGVTLMVAQSLGQAEPPGATTGARPRTAVIDLVRIFNECAQITDLNELILRKETELQTEAEQRRKVIENKQVELSAFRPGTADYEARRKDLVRLNIEANVWLKTSEQDLEREKFEWTRVLYENTTKATAKIAQEMGFDLVLQSKPFKPENIEQTITGIQRMIKDRPVVFAVPEVDITDRAIRYLDAQYNAAGGKRQLTPTARSTEPGP
jgi:Skp family chaperone for outer membrane proteins